MISSRYLVFHSLLRVLLYPGIPWRPMQCMNLEKAMVVDFVTRRGNRGINHYWNYYGLIRYMFDNSRGGFDHSVVIPGL